MQEIHRGKKSHRRDGGASRDCKEVGNQEGRSEKVCEKSGVKVRSFMWPPRKALKIYTRICFGHKMGTARGGDAKGRGSDAKRATPT